MNTCIGFDVYGTLIDTNGVVTRLQELIGDRAKLFSQAWRNKQLEYSFRRGLMRRYENFAVCTQDSLNYVNEQYGTAFSEETRQELLEIYKKLPAFDDVEPALVAMKSSGFRLYAFSNGSRQAVEDLLDYAGIGLHFIDTVSVDEIRTFKPDPDVYRHFMHKAGSDPETTWLVSGNPFDIIGALSCNMNTAWVKRNENDLFDPWGFEPTLTISNLRMLPEAVEESLK